MTQDESQILRQQRLFLDQLEQSVKVVNREIIHSVIPKLNTDVFTKMAEGVARHRVRYLAAATQLAGEEPLSPAQYAQLKSLREQFDESRAAFDAVKRAISRGYIDMAD